MPLPSQSSTSSNAPPHLIVRGNRVITPQGERPAAIHITSGIISSISAIADVPADSTIHEAGDSVVMPGLVDTHVHINEPGRTDWEGFSSATLSAAAGGVTTLIEMPLNSIPATTTSAALREKLAAANHANLSVDVGFWGGVVPGNATELRQLWHAGVFGFKAFLVPSGVAEFGHVTETDLRAALPELAGFGAPLLAHAELPNPIESATNALQANASPRAYNTWLAARPRAAENEAIALLERLAQELRVHIHIVHLSSSDAIPLLQRAKQAGVSLTVETCPHYLTFCAEEIPDGATQFKCAPPLRERENREKLWAALETGVIDLIASDHSPCPPAMKLLESGGFLRAWGGIASLQLGLPAVWTEAQSRGYSFSHMTKWMCSEPARLAGLAGRKGSIAPGLDADLVVWNPDARFRVEPAQLQHRHKTTPYAGRELDGVVETTFLRGNKIFDRGKFLSPPAGRILLRQNS
jgi:allantoinase